MDNDAKGERELMLIVLPQESVQYMGIGVRFLGFRLLLACNILGNIYHLHNEI